MKAVMILQINHQYFDLENYYSKTVQNHYAKKME